jgi:REP element-mobilizing transposase RayT
MRRAPHDGQNPRRLQLLHLVARAAGGARPFEHRLACADLWARLGQTFDLVACALMPNHVHVLAQVEPDVATRAFARVLSAFRLRMRALPTAPIEFEWEPLPRPEKVQRDRRHIARTVRYIHLNPSRDDLCSSPLEWEWSTHRDWVGAVARPCVDRPRWARAMGCHPRSCAEWLHQYVSSDASVRDTSPLADPRPFLADEPKDASIDALATAVVLVLRSAAVAPAEFGPVERRLFLLAAARWTRYRAPELARHVRCHRTNAWRAMRAATRERARVAAADDGPVVSERLQALRERSHVAPERSHVAPERLHVAPERLHTLNDDELRAMALALADRRLSTPPLRGALPARAPAHQHRVR